MSEFNIGDKVIIGDSGLPGIIIEKEDDIYNVRYLTKKNNVYSSWWYRPNRLTHIKLGFDPENILNKVFNLENSRKNKEEIWSSH